MKATNAHKTPEEYIASLPEGKQEVIIKLYDLIRTAAPVLEPFMQSGMIGFGKYHYIYASGREGDRFVIGLASQKNYFSLYNCVWVDGVYAAEKWEKKLGKVNCGKSCIRFTSINDIDLETVQAMVKEAAQVAKDHKFVFDSSKKSGKN